MEALEQRVLEILAAACDDHRVLTQPELDLYGEDLLDSFAWVQLLEGLEDAFDLEVWPTQVPPEETATPERVVGLVRRLLAEKKGG